MAILFLMFLMFLFYIGLLIHIIIQVWRSDISGILKFFVTVGILIHPLVGPGLAMLFMRFAISSR